MSGSASRSSSRCQRSWKQCLSLIDRDEHDASPKDEHVAGLAQNNYGLSHAAVTATDPRAGVLRARLGIDSQVTAPAPSTIMNLYAMALPGGSFVLSCQRG